jgi:hypothetical protein
LAVGKWLRRWWSEVDVEERMGDEGMRFPMERVFEEGFFDVGMRWVVQGGVYEYDEAE